MTEQQNTSPKPNNQPLLIVLIVIVVLLIIAVIALIFWTARPDQKGASEPTMTEAVLESTASITPEAQSTEEATATVTESPTEEAINEPTLESVKVVGTILSPVTNLIEDILGIDCDVFYDGTVKHPINN